MKTLLASVAAICLMGGAALADDIVLVPAGNDTAARGRTGHGAQAAGLGQYDRESRAGLKAPNNRSGLRGDPSLPRLNGRELFERGYTLGVMSAHARMTAAEMPEFEGQRPAPDGQRQASASDTGQEGAAMASESTPDPAGIAAQHTVPPENAESSEAEPVAAESAQIAIGSRDTEKYGAFIADDTGQPVYMFTADRQGTAKAMPQSNCYDACAEAWPPVTSSVMPPAENMADEDLVSTFVRKNGATQITYDGWPLYYFSKDQGAEMPTGQDVHGFGGEWYLLQPSGEKVGHE